MKYQTILLSIECNFGTLFLLILKFDGIFVISENLTFDMADILRDEQFLFYNDFKIVNKS